MILLEIFIVTTILSSEVLCTNNGRSRTFSKLVKDIIQNECVPSTLSAMTCWSKMDEINFMKSFSMQVQMIKLSAPFNLPFDENTNKQWFFIDMKCGRSTHFLSIVDQKYFAHPYRWIIADADHETIENLTFLPDSNVIIANEDSHSERYNLKQGRKYQTEFVKIFLDFDQNIYFGSLQNWKRVFSHL